MAKITGLVFVPGGRYLGPFRDAAEVGLPDYIFNEVIHLNIPELYFYGSRSKSYIHVDDFASDWDFAFQNNQQAVTELLNKGFVRKPVEDYTYADGFSFEVYEKKVGEHTIQLVSKNHLEMFKDVWDGIDNSFWVRYMNKRSKDYIGKEGVTSLMNQFRYMIESAIRKPAEDFL